MKQRTTFDEYSTKRKLYNCHKLSFLDKEKCYLYKGTIDACVKFWDLFHVSLDIVQTGGRNEQDI